MSSASELRPSVHRTALAVAWLTLAATLAGVAGYLVVARQAQPPGMFRAPLVALEEDVGAEAAPAEADTVEADTADTDAGETDAGPATKRDADDDTEAARAAPAAETPDPAAAEPAAEAPVAPDPATEESGPVAAEAPPPAPEAPETADAAPDGDAAPPVRPGESFDLAGADVPEEAAAGRQRVDIAVRPLWRQYATAVDLDRSRPSIAVVVSGLGLSSSATEAAIEHLPAHVTLSFSPYARRLNKWIALARVNGHEVMLDLPMEPVGYPNLDPGPHALLTSLAVDQNLERLDWILKRGSAYVGVAAMMGSRFTASQEHLLPIMREIDLRGLLFLDNRSVASDATRTVSQQLGMPLLMNDRAIDEAQASRVSIDARLEQVERLALTNGSAVAMGQPYPVTIERLRDWSALLEARGFTLVPITALVPRPQAG